MSRLNRKAVWIIGCGFGAMLGCGQSVSGAIAQSSGGQAAVPNGQQESSSAAMRSLAEEMVELIVDGLTPGNPSEQASVLRGLRRLGDRSLTPLFARLTLANDPLLRVHGLLGLAEIDPSRQLDLLSIQRLDDSNLVTLVAIEALEAGLLSQSQIGEMSGWPNINPSARVLLAARVVRAMDRQGGGGGGAARSVQEDAQIGFDRAAIVEAAKSDDVATAVASALILRQIGIERPVADATMRRTAEQLFSGPREPRVRLVAIIRDARLSEGVEVLERLATTAKDDPQLYQSTLTTWLTLAKDRTIPEREVLAGLAASNPLLERIMLAQRLLEHTVESRFAVPGSISTLLKADRNLLLATMGAAIEGASSDKTDVAGDVLPLIAQRHGPSLEWSLRLAQTRHFEDARAIRKAVLTALLSRGTGGDLGAQLAQAGATASSELASDDPEALRPYLTQALSTKDVPMVRAILEGMVRAGTAGCRPLVAGQAFETPPDGPWPTEDTAALAWLISTRNDAPTDNPLDRQPQPITTPEDVQRFASLARGLGGNTLGMPRRIQLAWLTLRAMEQDRLALARIFSKLDTPKAGNEGASRPDQPSSGQGQ